MENRKRRCARAFLENPGPPPHFYFLFFVFCLLSSIGCGAPAAPTPPRHPIPEPVADLKAQQLGDGVLLTFTLPTKAVDGIKLDGPPAIEIYRAAAAPPPPKNVKPPKNAPQLVFTIPSAMVQNYLTDNRVEFRDPLPQTILSNPTGEPLVYTVRTRASRNRASADSNAAAVRVFAALEPPTLLRVDVAETAMILTWVAPSGEIPPGAQPAGFHVYRVEIAPADVGPVRPHPDQFRLPKPLQQIGSSQDPQFRDTQFEFGHAYFYTVRAVARYAAVEVESADSRPVAIQPADIFPPAPPKNIFAIAVPATADSPARIELSWSIGSETDLAGYNVYRVEGNDAAARGERLNKDLLLAPAFRDLTAVPGRRYTYRITSVDRTGNESAPGDAVTVELPPPAE
jgi:hypothetical protein